ncbi:hypothetical protein EIP86_011207 [Pleurotus ostreatoroseus]|nr:hypothetical protein EIP86_011207 [Pleurotus ostreatoroseus]
MRGGTGSSKQYYLADSPNVVAPAQEQTTWNFQPFDEPLSLQTPPTFPSAPNLGTIKIPPMTSGTRSSTRQRAPSNASGSEYAASNATMEVDDQDIPDDDDDDVKPQPPPVELTKTKRGRAVRKQTYAESSGDDLDVIDQPEDNRDAEDEEDEEDEEKETNGQAPRYALRTRSKKGHGVIQSDEEGHTTVSGRYATRSRNKPSTSTRINGTSNGRLSKKTSSRLRKSSRKQRNSRPNSKAQNEEEDAYVDQPASSSSSADASFDEVAGTTPEPEPVEDADADAEGEADEPEKNGTKYALRQRSNINYYQIPPLEELKAPPPKSRSFGRTNSRGNRNKAPGWSASGAELSRWMGAADDSDSDYNTRTPRKNLGLGATGNFLAGSAGAGGVLPADLAAAAGTPSNLGKVGEASLADTDPLGVNQNVTFDEVGGLDDYIKALQEMTLLPLLYPEVFQRLDVTPPRGVLFHGPPGTGKTLLARALAASCRANGKNISFFMRKGADCLSKWVGEAERQLRLLFEEAKNSQPSIIFFDEIDGLAPVRSSKQDQIHASIVSTLLALMDGMDGRGQVIVIGATNRPDAVDPALRRPGRFDREFFFPLPNLDARERILRIMTRKWEGWEGEKGEDNAKGLAKLTKGYGGADLRALCTEAALNAIQRRYPQIYKSKERLLLQPETISVELRDFMISVKKLIPSSARATAPSASPLPDQMVPLLQQTLEKTKTALNKVIPITKARSALEEAEFEDEGDEGALAREMLMQSMETLRIYRPRIILHGDSGMGQSYVAAAALHHLEGFHVQSLDMGNLMSDSTRSPEAAIVQLFVEAKRHQPSVVYIPSLTGWSAAMSETSRSTVKAMLDSLAPTDPVLLLAVVDGPFSSLPRDIKAWFGSIRENRIQLPRPGTEQREKFFEQLLHDVTRPPNHFPDGIKRRKRVLEELPIAPPIEPRPPTAEELAAQEVSDVRTITMLKYRLGPILTELKRKFKRFTKRAMEEYGFDESMFQPQAPPQVSTVSTVEVQNTGPEGDVIVIDDRTTITTAPTAEEGAEPPAEEPQVNGVDGLNEAQMQMQVQVQPQLFDMDLERMHMDLYKDKYLTPDEFLDDIRKIVHNAAVRSAEDPERRFRAQAMLTAAEVSIQDFDATFRLECQRMAEREHRRRDEARKAREKAREAEEAANDSTYAPGTRRSARHNGQEPELSITDPLLLERRLKRQRSAETPAESDNPDAAEGRNAKRSRVSSNEVDGVTPSGSRLHTPTNRTHAVRFADDPMKADSQPSTPIADDLLPGPPVPKHPTPPNGLSGLLNPVPYGQLAVEPQLVPQPTETAINIDPVSVSIPVPSGGAGGVPQLQQVGPAPADMMSVDEKLLILDTVSTSEQAHAVDLMSVDEAASNVLGTQGDISVSSSTEPTSAAPTTTLSVSTTTDTVAEEPAVEEPMIVVERTPTPLPDFHVDEDLLHRLRDDFKNRTSVLNVEQLEQLRATCLGAVWRHRTEWDRTALLTELRDTVQEFVAEIVSDDMDAGSPY